MGIFKMGPGNGGPCVELTAPEVASAVYQAALDKLRAMGPAQFGGRVDDPFPFVDRAPYAHFMWGGTREDPSVFLVFRVPVIDWEEDG